MAVTIHQSPQGYTPSDNPVVWVFSSNQTAQANFSYLVEVYINGNLDSQNGPIFPTSGINAWFDAHEITSRSCVPPVIQDNSDDPIVDAENYCEVYIKVIERYGSPVTSHSSATSADVICWKARLSDEAFEAYDETVYEGNEAFVTEFPPSLNPKIRVDETHRLMLMSDNDELQSYEATLIDADGNTIISDSWSGSVTAPFCMINASPAVIIANIPAITLAHFALCDHYFITIQPSFASVISYRLDMNQAHRFSTAKRLHALTKIGCIEGFSFDLISRPTSKIDSESYQKKFGYIEGQAFIFDTNKGTEVDIAKVEMKSMSIESDWLVELEQHWLVENFYTSPAVYLENANGTLRRVKITNTSFAPMIQENDTLISEKVDLVIGTETSMIL